MQFSEEQKQGERDVKVFWSLQEHSFVQSFKEWKREEEPKELQ